MTTHYEVLGVPRTADAAAIRAAYIAQIKRYHPDRLRSKGGGLDEAKAQEINRAFDVLRDPAKREAYDLSLDAPAKPPPPPIRQPARRPAVLKPVAPVAVRPRKPIGRLILLILLILGATAAAWHWAPWPGRDRGAQAEEPAAEQPHPPEVEADDVDDAVTDLAWIAENGTAADALAYSRHCHAELSPQPRFSLLDRCTAFDIAAAKWLESQQPVGAAGVLPFFAGSVRERRFRQAMALLAADPVASDERLEWIDRLTGAAFGRIPAVTRPPSAAPKAPPFEGIGD